MSKIDSLTLRVNGLICERAMIRFAIEDGFPGGEVEIVMVDPLLGEIVLTDQFHLEVQKAPSQSWKVVSLKELNKIIREERKTHP